jgi:hypothetical protein
MVKCNYCDFKFCHTVLARPCGHGDLDRGTHCDYNAPIAGYQFCIAYVPARDSSVLLLSIQCIDTIYSTQQSFSTGDPTTFLRMGTLHCCFFMPRCFSQRQPTGFRSILTSRVNARLCLFYNYPSQQQRSMQNPKLRACQNVLDD